MKFDCRVASGLALFGGIVSVMYNQTRARLGPEETVTEEGHLFNSGTGEVSPEKTQDNSLDLFFNSPWGKRWRYHRQLFEQQHSVQISKFIFGGGLTGYDSRDQSLYLNTTSVGYLLHEMGHSVDPNIGPLQTLNRIAYYSSGGLPITVCSLILGMWNNRRCFNVPTRSPFLIGGLVALFFLPTLKSELNASFLAMDHLVRHGTFGELTTTSLELGSAFLSYLIPASFIILMGAFGRANARIHCPAG